MIHSFSCKNFYSFGELTTLDFVVNQNAPENSGYFLTGSKTRLSKVITVVGPNASGKTNLLKMLPFLKWLIVDSFKADPESPLPVKPFIFTDSKVKPIELSVVFEIDSKIYTYDFSLNEHKILSEKLMITSFVKEKKSTKKVFSRIWNSKENQYDFDDDKFGLSKDFKNLLRTNASVISTASRLNHQESRSIAKTWQRLETNVVEAGWVGDRLLPNATQQMFEALDFYSENEPLKKEAEKLLCRFDLGLAGFDIKKEKTENGLTLQAHAVHSINGNNYNLNLSYESSGTKQLFVLLKSILTALAYGSVVVIDEFDVNLHPEMVIALFGLFTQEETNPKNAQLLFSTQSHLILNELDKYQIVLVEKNEHGISEAWRLDEMSDVRSDDNYYTKYLAGAYGAVPEIQ